MPDHRNSRILGGHGRQAAPAGGSHGQQRIFL
jgi:hypothetical protein